MEQTLITLVSTIASIALIIIDGRRAVERACLAVVIGLVATQAIAVGFLGAAVMVGIAVAGFVFARIAGPVAQHISHEKHQLSPLTIFRTPREDLFGYRSTRVIAAGIALFAASWVSFNISVGSIATIDGVMYPVILVWLCGGFRLFLARSLEDVACGMLAMCFAVGVGWNVRSGLYGSSQSLVLFGFAAVLMVVTAIFQGRTEAVLALESKE